MSYEPNPVWTTETNALEATELTIIARSMMAARKALHGPIPTEFIHDPALDILLRLFVARVAEDIIDLQTLVAATTVAVSTATRWVDALQRQGFIQRSGSIVCLSEKGYASVAEMLRAVARSQWEFGDERV